MKGAYIFFANGFEETEALAPIDVLRRGGVDLRIVSIYDDRTVTGSHGIPMVADMSFGEFLERAELEGTAAGDLMLFPGGMPGSTNLAACDKLMELMLRHYEEGGTVAAICAAPLVLGGLGLTKGRRATCYPGFEDALIGATICGANVETDGNVITGKGPGLVFDFGLALVRAIKGEAVAEEVAAGMLLA